MTVDLLLIVSDYYPHLSKAEAFRKANNQDYPFSVFKIDQSKRAPFLVHIEDLAAVLDKQYSEASKDFATLHRSGVAPPPTVIYFFSLSLIHSAVNSPKNHANLLSEFQE